VGGVFKMTGPIPPHLGHLGTGRIVDRLLDPDPSSVLLFAYGCAITVEMARKATRAIIPK